MEPDTLVRFVSPGLPVEAGHLARASMVQGNQTPRVVEDRAPRAAGPRRRPVMQLRMLPSDLKIVVDGQGERPTFGMTNDVQLSEGAGFEGRLLAWSHRAG